MSRIVKSSHVTIGSKKEIDICCPNKFQVESIHTEEQHVSEQEQIKELEKLMNKKLVEAEEQARLIINMAHEQAKEILENAKNEGYNVGKEQGYDDAKSEANAIIHEALGVKQEIMEMKSKITKNIEREVVELVIKTTETILNTKVEDSYEMIIGLVKLGLEKCAYTESLVIRVSPEDYGYMISVKDKIVCLTENIEDLTIKQDASLKKGSCILDTHSGSIDCSINMQFKHMVEIFKHLLESE